ncbi:MAG: hypothetical protein J6K92_07000 [Oscillospiraceae bacterium]|nr:hypothetical protein [Oscillospiraceae bacterium]
MPAKTHKTPQLMKLLTGGSQVSNPILDENFKEEIIRSRENPVPVKPVASDDGGTEINITSELISQWLPLVMKRFNVCTCGRCTAEATVEAFDKIRPIIVKVKSDIDLQRAQDMKLEKEQSVLMQLIRIIIPRKKLPRHDT